jgi:4-hydroxy-tetrahydrodipicolinate synthase
VKTTPLPQGIITPLVALVTETGAPDVEAMNALVEHQISGRVSGILVNGSMGELGNLTGSQRHAMARTVVTAAAGRIPVWAGAAGLGTADTVTSAKESADAGVDAVLALPPLFFDVSDTELMRHFEAVGTSIDVPLLAYDVPPRTPRKLAPVLIAKLAADGVIQGVKDSSGNLSAARQLCLLTESYPDFRAYIGTEVAIDAAVALGFDGSVPGLANILPGVGAAIDAAARRGDYAEAEQSQLIYVDLLRLLDIPLAGASPVTVAFDAFKAATTRVLRLSQSGTLPPLTAPDQEFLDNVAAIVDPLLPK